MDTPVEYANWWSRAFFHDAFDQQFFIPVPPPAWASRLLEATERLAFPASKVAHHLVEKPVFVIGLPRSGTTMLYNLLAAHEQAAYITNAMNSFPDAIGSIEWLRKALQLNVRGERFLKDSVVTEFGGPSEMQMFWGRWTGRDIVDLDWESNPVEVTDAMIARVHLDLKRVLHAFGPAARRIVIKNPVFQPEMPALQQMFPDARFIHIVRDGRMVANSLIKMYRRNNAQLERIRHPLMRSINPYPRTRTLSGIMAAYGPDTVEATAHVWQDSIQLVRRLAPTLNHLIEVRYEDLLADPHGETARLLEFCDLPWPSPSQSAFHEQLAGVGSIHHENRYGDFEVVERIAGETLAHYGYTR
jgi:hypothetical protein